MDKVMAAMKWLRQNPLSLTCLVIVVLALASLYYPTHFLGASLRSDMDARKRDLTTVRSLQNSPVQVPASAPNQPPISANITVTDSTIQKLEKVYEDLDEQYELIFEAATQINRSGHDPMLPGLFPWPSDFSKPFNARDAYQAAFPALREQLDAGSPPTNDEVQKMLDEEEAGFRRRLLLPPGSILDESQTGELRRLQAERLKEMIQERAENRHIYAAKVELGRDIWNPGPFQVQDWARPGPQPEMQDIWEGQMRLWIQQDLVYAIRGINRISDTETSLADQPIKRLLSIQVDPNYIGEVSGGRIAGGAASESQMQQVITKMEAAVQTQLPANFVATPTGRVSNPLYDVRHTTVKMIVDSQRLPEIFNGITTANFMTIIGVSITDVDEYAHMREGYFYGFGVDAVELTLKIESLWLRRWTVGHLTEEKAVEAGETYERGLMPDAVRHRLGLPTRDRNFVPKTTGTGLVR